jgi:hypothetical protein
MIELGGLRADAVEMGLISLLFAEERQVGGCWRSSRSRIVVRYPQRQNRVAGQNVSESVDQKTEPDSNPVSGTQIPAMKKAPLESGAP